MCNFPLFHHEVSDEEVLAAIRSIPVHRADLQLDIPFGPVALAAATYKSVAGCKAPANQRVVVEGFYIGFDGVTSTSVPALVEVCHCDFSTNSPGTNSTAVTPVATDSEMTETPQTSAAQAWTAGNEPTVITVKENFLIPTYMGTGIVYYPLRRLMKLKGSKGMVLRIKAPAIVNCVGTIPIVE